MRRSLPGVAAAVLLLASGCATVDSADLRTSGMTASIVVVAGAEDSQVTVVLSAGGLTSVELTGDDELTAASGEVRTVLDHDEFLGSDSYAGGLPKVADPSTEVTVSLTRGDDDSAPDSVVQLPGPIFVVQPKATQSVSRGQDLTVGVNQGAGTVRVEWSGSCLSDGSLDFAEGDPVVVPADSVLPTGASGAPPNCTATFTVSRISTGTLDPAYDGGSITAQRSQAVAVESVP